MEGKYLCLSDEDFTLTATDKKNQMRFFRNDGKAVGPINDLPRDPFDFLEQIMVICSFTDSEWPFTEGYEIHAETAEDGSIMLVGTQSSSTVTQKHKNFFRSLKEKIFG